MRRCSVQPRDPINICKRLWFFDFFWKKNGQKLGKNISKNISSKYSQKLLYHAKQSAIDALKTASKQEIQKAAGVTGDLICNKVPDKITIVLRTSLPNSSETVTNEVENITLDRKTETEYYWWTRVNIKVW